MPNQYTFNPRKITKPCDHCGEPMETYPKAIARGHGKFCSLACTTAARRVPLADRFWTRVEKSGDCWPWNGRLNHAGYGEIDSGGHSRNGGRPLLAHRVSWELHYGSIPSGLHVLHQCDNPPCCNPAHLFLGTNTDNVRDKVEKARQHRGERSPLSKLTEQQVMDIRARYATGTIMQKDLCAEYGVSPATMSQLLSGKLWRHLLNQSDS